MQQQQQQQQQAQPAVISKGSKLFRLCLEYSYRCIVDVQGSQSSVLLRVNVALLASTGTHPPSQPRPSKSNTGAAVDADVRFP
jgi:hypothetical protein